MRFRRRGRGFTSTDVGLALVAAVSLLLVDASTRAVGLARTARGLAALADRLPPSVGHPDDLERRVSTVVVSLRRASRVLVWGGDCLPRALILWAWLRRAGEQPSLELGVRRDGGTLHSHAWVTWRGRAVGEPEDMASNYVTFSEAVQG